MKRAILAGVLALFPFAALADDGIGRYQALAVPGTNEAAFAGRIIFLDTRDGHVWEWRNARATGNTAGSEGFTYLGKLTPGASSPSQLMPQSEVGKCFTFNGKQFCE